ncbi:MAG: SAM-dependent methyltransferase [Pseudomonadota bacterium]
MKTTFFAALWAVLVLTGVGATAQVYTAPADAPQHIKRGVAAADRTEEQTARDMARKPAEILMIAGLEEGDHIADISSFGQYFTTIMAEAVGPSGRIDMYDMPYMEQFGAVESGNTFAASHSNSTYTVVHYNDIELGTDLDAVYIVLYYHDLASQMVDTGAFNAKVLAALKPGGKYLIVDHKAEDGSGWRDAGTIHRIGKEVILQEVQAAGFNLLTDSDLLENPADDRTKMVFTPGTRGSTDQVVYVFQKPL